MDKRNFLLLPIIGIAALFSGRRARAEGIYNPAAMQSASLNGAGHLILKTSAGQSIDAGSIVSGLPVSLVFSWGGTVASSGTYELPAMPYGINVTSLSYVCPAGNVMTAGVLSNGAAVGNLSVLNLSGSGTIPASGAGLAVLAGSSLALVLSAVSSTTSGVAIQINGVKI